MSTSKNSAPDDTKRQRTGEPTTSARERNNGELEHVMLHYLSVENERLHQDRDDWREAWQVSDARASRILADNDRLARDARRHLGRIRLMHDVQEQLFDLCLHMFEQNRELLGDSEQEFYNILRHPVNVIDLTDITTDEELSDEE